MSQLRAVLVGAVESTRIALEAIGRNRDWTLAGVVTLDAALSHRHSDFVDLADPARRLGSRLIPVRDINRDDALAAIGALAPDYVVVVGWSQICGPRFLELAPARTIGYYPAALPRLRGRAAIPWTILEREPITAGTLFWIDRGVDTGAILDQHFFHVAPLETAATLYAKHMAALSSMLDHTLSALARGEVARRPQNEVCATWAARRTPTDGLIGWAEPADAVLRLVRASGRPYPGAYTLCAGEPFQVWAGELAIGGERHTAQNGQVIAADAAGVTVKCGGHTALTVTEWSGPPRPPRLGAILGAA